MKNLSRETNNKQLTKSLYFDLVTIACLYDSRCINRILYKAKWKAWPKFVLITYMTTCQSQQVQLDHIGNFIEGAKRTYLGSKYA